MTDILAETRGSVTGEPHERDLITERDAETEEQPNAEAEAILTAINRYAHVPLTAEDVYVRGMWLCNDIVDRYWSRFTVEALAEIADLLPSESVLVGHDSQSLPVGRVFSAERVQREDGHYWVRAAFYWLKGVSGADDLARNIDGGVYKEVSLRWRYSAARCSICGQDIRTCPHLPGREYDGETCTYEMSDIREVLEASLVFKGGQRDTQLVSAEAIGESQADASPSEAGAPVLEALTAMGQPNGPYADLVAQRARIYAKAEPSAEVSTDSHDEASGPATDLAEPTDDDRSPATDLPGPELAELEALAEIGRRHLESLREETLRRLAVLAETSGRPGRYGRRAARVAKAALDPDDVLREWADVEEEFDEILPPTGLAQAGGLERKAPTRDLTVFKVGAPLDGPMEGKRLRDNNQGRHAGLSRRNT